MSDSEPKPNPKPEDVLKEHDIEVQKAQDDVHKQDDDHHKDPDSIQFIFEEDEEIIVSLPKLEEHKWYQLSFGSLIPEEHFTTVLKTPLEPKDPKLYTFDEGRGSYTQINKLELESVISTREDFVNEKIERLDGLAIYLQSGISLLIEILIIIKNVIGSSMNQIMLEDRVTDIIIGCLCVLSIFVAKIFQYKRDKAQETLKLCQVAREKIRSDQKRFNRRCNASLFHINNSFFCS